MEKELIPEKQKLKEEEARQLMKPIQDFKNDPLTLPYLKCMLKWLEQGKV